MLTRIRGRLTGDMDIISEGMHNDLRQACETVALKHNLAPDWINDGAKGFTVSVDLEPERIFTGQRLILDSAGPRYLLAMKLLSGRRADEEDCIHLIREVGAYGIEQLLDFMEVAAGVRGLTPRHEHWAQEMLAKARRGRRLRGLRRSFVSLARRPARNRTVHGQKSSQALPSGPQATPRQCGAP